MSGLHSCGVSHCHRSRHTTILTLRNVHDIWTSHLQDRSLVLGANMKVALMRDIERQAVEMLATKSDVFAAIQTPVK